MSITERRGIYPRAGSRSPCAAYTSTAITLSGEKTVDGRAVVAGDRVLVGGQGAPADNGVYVVNSGTWTRSADLNDSSEFSAGVLVVVHNPDGVTAIFKLISTASPFVMGTSAITVEMLNDLSLLDEDDLDSDSDSAAPTQQSVKAYIDAAITAATTDFVIDEDDMASDSAVKVPTQQSVKAYVDSQTYTPITAIQTTYTSDDTHSYNADCLFALVRVQGAGGGGGGGAAGSASSGGCGGSGGYVEGFVDVAGDSITTATIAVGAAGTGGATSTDGTAGEDSSYTDSENTFTGGGGGAGQDESDDAGSAAGTATGGYLNIPGHGGGPSGLSWTAGYQPNGIDSKLGLGGMAYEADTTSKDASGYGASGAGGIGNGTAAEEAGGEGSPGIVTIIEFFQ